MSELWRCDRMNEDDFMKRVHQSNTEDYGMSIREAIVKMDQ